MTATASGRSASSMLAGAWGPRDGLARPDDVVRAYAAQARRRGARIIEGTAVAELRVERGRVTAVRTARGDISPGLVVDAAGPQAALVAAMVGVDLPVHPRRRHVFVTEPVQGVRHPLPLVVEPGFGFYVRSEGDALLMSPGDVGPVDDPSSAPPVDWTMREVTLAKAAWRIPGLSPVRIRDGWAGLRPLTPDEHAIIDAVPGVANMLCAVGFGGHGFQHSPATGMAVAELVLDGRTSIDIADLRLRRFARTHPSGATT